MYKNNLKEKLKSLIETSSWHALPNIVRTDSNIIRIIWTISFLAAFGYCSYTLALLVIDYLSFDVLMTINTVQDYDRDFPAVTVCNLNAIDFSIEQNRKTVESYLFNQLQISGNILGYNNNQTSNKNICSRKIKDVVRLIPKFSNYSYTIDKMLISCYYDDTECSKNDFSLAFAPLYGNCISFNVGKNLTNQRIPVKKSRRPGLVNGLQLEIFVGAPEYQPCWSTNVGALVVVHHKDVSPLYSEDGNTVAVGAETSLIIDAVKTTKLSSPYSDCVTDVYSNSSYDSDSYRSTVNSMGVYSQKWCILNCALAKVSAENLILCQAYANASRFLFSTCMANRQNLSSYYEECTDGCPEPCQNTDLNVKTSFADFPTLARNKFYLTDNNILSRFPYSNVTEAQLKASILSINVFFSTSSNEEISETPATSIPNLLANLGGQMGLMLGCSMLSFIEIIEIIFEVIFYIGTKILKNNRIISKCELNPVLKT